MALDIEKLLEEKRDQMDVETPPSNLWSGIESKIDLKPKEAKKELIAPWVWKVAAIFLLALSTTLFIMLQYEKSESNQLASLGDISESYGQVEIEYQKVILELEGEMEITPVHREEFSWLFEELEYLDVVNTEYRKEIDSHGGKEQVINALVDYYEKKIKILKRIQLEINRKNNEKDNEVNI